MARARGPAGVDELIVDLLLNVVNDAPQVIIGFSKLAEPGRVRPNDAVVTRAESIQHIAADEGDHLLLVLVGDRLRII